MVAFPSVIVTLYLGPIETVLISSPSGILMLNVEPSGILEPSLLLTIRVRNPFISVDILSTTSVFVISSSARTTLLVIVNDGSGFGFVSHG